MMVEVLQQVQQGRLAPKVQPEQGVTYAHKIGKNEASIDWQLPAEVIERRIRAFNPFPVASTTLGPEVIKIWRAEIDRQTGGSSAAPGTLVAVGEQAVSVQCGRGVLRLTELQRAGAKRLPVADFLRGFALQVGVVFQSVSSP
jgi:methionyl-tRNA formyltransferase